MTKLLFATNNPHKLGEIRSMLGSRFTVLSLQDIGFSGEIPEDRPTLEENASKKAFFLFRRCGCDCFADDTGLEVEALDGEPGFFPPGMPEKEKMPMTIRQNFCKKWLK